MLNMSKRQQLHRYEKCQLIAIHGSLMDDMETLNTQSRLKNNFIHRYSEIVAPIYSSNKEVN